MSERNDRLTASNLWVQLDAVKSAVENAAASDSTPEVARPVLARTRKIETRVRQLLEGVDPDLVNLTVLEDFANQFANIAGWVNSCADGSDQSDNIAAVLDNSPSWLTQLAASLPFAVSTGKATVALTAIRREAEAVSDDLALRAAKLAENLNSLESIAQTLRAEIADASAQLQATLDENAMVVVHLRELVDAEKTAALAKIDSDAVQRLTALDDAATKKFEEIEVGLNTQILNGQNILTHLGVIESDINDMAATIGDRVLAGDYGTLASVERKTANLLRMSALIALVGAAFLAIWVAFGASTGTITWQRVVAKLAATVVLSGLASYLISQSREHRDEERQARRRHLDLKALGPFIVDLTVEQQQTIRNQHALKAFLIERPEPAESKLPRKGFSFDELKIIAEIMALRK